MGFTPNRYPLVTWNHVNNGTTVQMLSNITPHDQVKWNHVDNGYNSTDYRARVTIGPINEASMLYSLIL